MKIAVARFDYLGRGGQAWVRLIGDAPDSGLEPIPTLEMTMHFAVRASQSEPANDSQIVVTHPAVPGRYVVAGFSSSEDTVIGASGQNRTAWPDRNAYSYKAVQLVANLVATAELDTFDGAIPRVIP
jgi:hypothetical protein